MSHELKTMGEIEHVDENGSGSDSPPTKIDGEQINVPVAGDDADFKFTFGKFIAIASLQVGYMAAVFALQMSSAVLTTINTDIGPSTAFAWISTSQVIPVGVFSPLVGRLGDIFGRRNFILFGNLCGVIGCVVCATAKSVNVVIGGGIFIGVASACQQLAWAALGELVPRKYRGLALGLFELTCAPPGAFGPIMGNAIAAYASWRWVYWVPFILNSIGLVSVFLFYRPRNQYIREEGKTRMQEVKDLDWVGFALYTVGLLLFLLGISFGGNELSWHNAGPILMIVLGVVLLILFGFYEAFKKQVFPLFPPVVLGKIREVTLVLIGTFLYGMLFYSTAVLWPQQVQALYTTDLIHIGWYASVLGICGIVSSPLFGFLFTLGHARILFVGIIALATVAAGCGAIVTPTSNIGSSVIVGLMGVSVGGGMIVATAMVQLAVKHEHIGIASSLAITARNVGGAVGTVIYVSIFTDRLKAFIPKYVVLPLVEAGVPLASVALVTEAFIGDAPESTLASLTPAQLQIGANGVKEAYAHSFRIVYLSSIAFGVLATVAVSFCRNMDKYMTNKIDVVLDEGVGIGGVTDTGEGHILTAQEIEFRHEHGEHSHGDGSSILEEL